MRVLVACEFSGIVRDAFAELRDSKGERKHEVWSIDLEDCEKGVESGLHHTGDVREYLVDGFGAPWDMLIAFPPCTRLANSGVRWLKKAPPGKTLKQMWKEFADGVELYKALQAAPIPLKAIENPIMHRYARERLGLVKRQIVQPWYFGEPYFKATGFELHGLPELWPTKLLSPPKKGTREHKAWSKVHRASPGPNRWKDRSRTFQGIADAMAQQWGGLA